MEVLIALGLLFGGAVLPVVYLFYRSGKKHNIKTAAAVDIKRQNNAFLKTINHSPTTSVNDYGKSIPKAIPSKKEIVSPADNIKPLSPQATKPTAPIDEFDQLANDALDDVLTSTALGRHYKVLGLPSIATLDEVKAQCKVLAKEWHPDLHRQDPNKHKAAIEKMKKFKIAYEAIVAASAVQSKNATNKVPSFQPAPNPTIAASTHIDKALGNKTGMPKLVRWVVGLLGLFGCLITYAAVRAVNITGVSRFLIVGFLIAGIFALSAWIKNGETVTASPVVPNQTDKLAGKTVGKPFGLAIAIFISVIIVCFVNLAIHVPFIAITGEKMRMGPLTMINTIAFIVAMRFLYNKSST
jgi:hypothetical protein